MDRHGQPHYILRSRHTRKLVHNRPSPYSHSDSWKRLQLAVQQQYNSGCLHTPSYRLYCHSCQDIWPLRLLLQQPHPPNQDIGRRSWPPLPHRGHRGRALLLRGPKPLHNRNIRKTRRHRNWPLEAFPQWPPLFHPLVQPIESRQSPSPGQQSNRSPPQWQQEPIIDSSLFLPSA